MTAVLLDEKSLLKRPAPVRAERKNPRDWRWQVRHAVTRVPELAAALELTPEERAGADRAARAGLPMSITPYYLGLCDQKDRACPVRMQCVPHGAEEHEAHGDL